MSCALPCTWWCCTIEPVWAPPRKLRTKSLSYVCSGLFCKPNPLFCFICGIRVASKSNVDSIPYSKRCSHISMWILILLDHRDCHPNSFQPTCSFSSGSDHFNIREINSQFFATVFASSVPSCLCFSRPPTLFLQGLRFLNQVSFLFMGSLSILFRQCSYPVILRKVLTELQVHHSFFFSGGFNSSFRC